MNVTTPPAKPDSHHERDLEQRVADLEALIEEARRRARQRRTRRGAAAALLVAAGAAALIGFGGHGGGGAGTAATAHARASSRSAAALSTAAVAPPKCSDSPSKVSTATTAAGQTLWVALPRVFTTHGHSTFTQFCGPATVTVRAHGRAFRIHSGYCDAGATEHYWPYQLFVGLEGHTPAAPAKFLEIAVHTPRAIHGGTFPASGAMQLGGRTFATAKNIHGGITNWTAAVLPRTITEGTVTIAKSLRAGTFDFRLRDSTQITGNWTCG
jgi:hypothetical protein